MEEEGEEDEEDEEEKLHYRLPLKSKKGLILQRPVVLESKLSASSFVTLTEFVHYFAEEKLVRTEGKRI